ncbi:MULTISPECIES: HAD family hydrolase [unclassified Moraxella]|uniref:HAD family hydrolase n=1 Tax=unclassified Moraxella TaxID=2685852 RepID=UPI003AF8D2CF
MNNTEIKAVLFDLDGTLIDTAPDFIRIIKVMCAKHNHPCPTDEAIREQVSAGARAMVKLMFGELANIADDAPQAEKQLLAYRQEFLDTYEADICVDSRLFDGLDELLLTLESNGILWGIVTNKPRYLTEILLDKLNLTERCSVLVCPDDVKNTKPDPEPMFLAVSKLNDKFDLDLVAENCVYVGDHIRDIQAGKSANMRTILAGYGYIPPQDQHDLNSWGADVITHSVEEMTDYIRDWTGV